MKRTYRSVEMPTNGDRYIRAELEDGEVVIDIRYEPARCVWCFLIGPADAATVAPLGGGCDLEGA